MVDYSQQIHDLKFAAGICYEYRIKTPVNGVQPDYPRWPEAWKACEKIWQSYLDLQTVLGPTAEQDHRTILRELGKLR